MMIVVRLRYGTRLRGCFRDDRSSLFHSKPQVPVRGDCPVQNILDGNSYETPLYVYFDDESSQAPRKCVSVKFAAQVWCSFADAAVLMR